MTNENVINKTMTSIPITRVRFFNWKQIARFYHNFFPLSFLEMECISERDAKFITGVLFIGLGVACLLFLIPAVLILISALLEEKGGLDEN